jgi:hypothetical protein
VVGLIDSCVKQPEYSVVPHIDLIDITFKPGNLNVTPAIPDTIIYRVKFRDGDGDLGFLQDDTTIEYFNPWYYVYNPTNFSILRGVSSTDPIPSGYQFINYKAKRTVPQFDTLPELVCGSWELLKNSVGQTIDTIYIRQNLRAYNVNVNVFVKNNSGVYVAYDPGYDFTSCNPNQFRAAFPDVSNDGKPGPLDGTLTWRLQSYNFLHGSLNTKTLKMDITINDRAYNISNTVEKADFTLQQITK